jgi:hypothetical protein
LLGVTLLVLYSVVGTEDWGLLGDLLDVMFFKEYNFMCEK